ncbi:glycosyltransferase family 39 protein [Cellulomonas sp. Leaf395]|uniref:glycosyltransferase family 39 protein n=1 Tax=Cellulomonas sp. Leaf395 TaxID=1736362 RepID=UPI0006FB4647|nr:glycosyltransferase family 39 protein [Cellulomonas sp. Leaf395]KQT02343.1 hypothetical protein ASG23_03155 [Cellulomonas sp. Leaf395]
MSTTAAGTSTPPSTAAADTDRRWVLRDALVLASVVVVLGVAGAWIPSLWLDEVATVSAVGRSWSEMAALLGHVDAVHGTYYTVLHLWADVFGTSPLSLRVPSALAMGVVAAGVVVLGNDLGTRATGILSGCVLAVLPATTWMGAEARSYAFVTAATTWASVVLLRALHGRAPWWAYAVLIGVSGLLFVQSLVLVLAHGITLVWARVERTVLRPWLFASAGALVIMAPAVLVGARQRYQVEWIDRPGLDSVPAVLTRQWFDGSWWLTGAVVLLVAAVLVAPRWAASAWASRPVSLVQATLPWAVVPTLVVLAVSVVATPLWIPRYLRYCVPAIALLVGAGLEALRRRWAQVAAVVALTALAAPLYAAQRSEFGKDGADWSAAARFVAADHEAGDAVVFVPEDESRSPRRASDGYPQEFAGLDDIGHGADVTTTDSLWERGRPVTELGDELGAATRVWVLSTDGEPSQEALRWLESEGFTGEVVWSGPTTQVRLLTPPAS